jgi:hypothetical protein
MAAWFDQLWIGPWCGNATRRFCGDPRFRISERLVQISDRFSPALFLKMLAQFIDMPNGFRRIKRQLSASPFGCGTD